MVYWAGGSHVYFSQIFFFQAEDGIRDVAVTGVQTCALPIFRGGRGGGAELRGKVDFADEPLAQQAGAHLRVEHLDRDPAVWVVLHRQVDPGHAPGTDLALDIVAGRQGRAQGVEHVEHVVPTYRRAPHLANHRPALSISDDGLDRKSVV